MNHFIGSPTIEGSSGQNDGCTRVDCASSSDIRNMLIDITSLMEKWTLSPEEFYYHRRSIKWVGD